MNLSFSRNLDIIKLNGCSLNHQTRDSRNGIGICYVIVCIFLSVYINIRTFCSVSKNQFEVDRRFCRKFFSLLKADICRSRICVSAFGKLALIIECQQSPDTVVFPIHQSKARFVSCIIFSCVLILIHQCNIRFNGQSLSFHARQSADFYVLRLIPVF